MARLPKGAESSITILFLVMCAEKILRLLRLFFVAIHDWFCTWYSAGRRRIALGNISLLETSDPLAAL
jgi:hypothetical protein